MTAENLCVRCGRPTDAYVCRPEAQALAGVLLTAAGHAEDAVAVLTGQVRYGGGSRGGNGEDPMPNLAAAVHLGRINTAVRFWTDDLRDGEPLPAWRRAAGPPCQDGARCPHASCAALRVVNPPSALAQGFAWLSGQTEALRRHPAADEAFRDLERACADLARLVDRPVEKDLVGRCDCGARLYAHRDQAYVICAERTCKLKWNTAESRKILLAATRDQLFTASECARWAAFWTERTQPQIRALITTWTRPDRHRLEARGWIPNDDYIGDGEEPQGWATYLLGDVLDLLAQTPRRNREGAAA